MKPLMLTLLLAISFAATVHAQDKEKNDNHRFDITVGIASPKAAEVFAQYYKSKGLQPRLTAEMALLHLPYSTGLNARISAIAGLEPQSFDNVTTYLTEVRMTQKPLGGRFYPFVFRNGWLGAVNTEKWRDKMPILAFMVDMAGSGAAWLLNGVYIEGGISPAVKMKEEGYADVTRSPYFTGWGVNLLDLNPENNLRFKFNVGQRKYTWTNASNTTSQIRSFCMDMGISIRMK